MGPITPQKPRDKARSTLADVLSDTVRLFVATNNLTLSNEIGNYLSLRFIENQTIPDKLR